MNYGFTPSLATAGLATSSDLDDDVDEDFTSIKKQLFNCDTTPATKKQAVQVFLRVRPKSTLEIQLKQPECFHFPNGNQELIAIAPKSSQSYKSKTATHTNSKYTFTKIFGPDTTQVDLFEETLLPSLKDFLEGQNCLVFTYGVTNSGEKVLTNVCLIYWLTLHNEWSPNKLSIGARRRDDGSFIHLDIIIHVLFIIM